MDIILLIGTIESAFLFLLIVGKKDKKLTDWALALMFLFYTLSIGLTGLETLNANRNFPSPFVINLSWLILFLQGPALWLYVKSLTTLSHSPCFALFTVEKDEPRNWIKLGEVYQRFALTATKHELSHAHANMPCEEKPVRRKMTEQLGLQNQIPLLLIRLGYSKPMPYSFRRHLNEVITR